MTAALVALTMAPAAHAAGDTTGATIVPSADGRLTTGPGEAHVVRDDLATRSAAAVRRPLLSFAQLSDTHVVDEESPLRVEFTDKLGTIFTSAYRPQEAATAQVLDRMVAQVRNATSPITGRGLKLVMTTGDNTDNTQCNETRWVIDLLTGGRTVDPDSGVGPLGVLPARELCLGGDATGSVAVPVPSGCDANATGRRYDGVRGGDFYEPDGGGDPAYAGVRDFPGFLEKANVPFTATGLGGTPWYAVFGNHDGLIQGNQPRNPGLEELATGCLKVKGVSDEAMADLAAAPDRDQAMAAASAKLVEAAAAPGGATEIIQADPRRRPLRKSEWIAEHLKDAPGYGHGFTAENLSSGMGNYVLQPRPGLRFVVLDTISEHGLEEGNLDDAQFRWLHEQLLLADAARERVVLFAHHSLRTMGQPPVSPFAPGDAGGSLMPDVHFGEGPRQSGQKTPCTTADAAAPTLPGETLRCLALRHPSVVAFVNGHEHANRIDPVSYGADDAVSQAGRGFWEINTAAHIDFPQQSRLLDLVANDDGTLSIFTTVVDHDAPANPGGGATTSPKRLASISRELSFSEPQSGREGPRGRVQDRNAELVVADPAVR
ncbi:MAG TPA: hypothetical protein VD931_22045 [Baekduia sp.]|nr:hypothetical protein [Baekduia sp.]